MKKILALVLLLIAVGTLVAVVARTRSAAPRPRAAAKGASVVDVDFTTLNDTMRAVKIVELMRTPHAFAKKKIRIDGITVSGEGSHGARICGLQIYDAGGCCPLLTVEYRTNFTFAPPGDGTSVVLEGEVTVLGQIDRPRIVVANATVRAK